MDKKDDLIVELIAAILLLAMGCYICVQIDNSINKNKSYIGTDVIIGSDTLIIVDYSSLYKTYTLSNGVEVGFDFVQKDD